MYSDSAFQLNMSQQQLSQSLNNLGKHIHWTYENLQNLKTADML